MSEFAYLAYLKEYPEAARNAASQGRVDYTPSGQRQRAGSMCVTTLSPVAENEAQEYQKKAKRRFSLDFMFSKKKKDFKLDTKRFSTDSTLSETEETLEQRRLSKVEEIRRASVDSRRASKAEIEAWCFA